MRGFILPETESDGEYGDEDVDGAFDDDGDEEA
jgi:hypothetical protein